MSIVTSSIPGGVAIIETKMSASKYNAQPIGIRLAFNLLRNKVMLGKNCYFIHWMPTHSFYSIQIEFDDLALVLFDKMYKIS